MSTNTWTNGEQFVGAYGPSYREGVLIDNLEAFVTAGGSVRVGKHGTWASLPGAAAIPVVCGDIVRIDTEDGPSDGRCGRNLDGERGACPAHADERDTWMAMSERERADWEGSN